MEITIHQCLCGENNRKAWGLLSTTLTNNTIAQSIAFLADLQDRANDVVWIPTIRGFMKDDFFLLMKTYRDNSLGVRPGRVFSHVLLISKNDINVLEDIDFLLKYFSETINKSILIEPIVVNLNKQSVSKFHQSFNLRFNKAIIEITKSEDNSITIVWIGEADFELAVCRIWQILSFEEKQKLNIGIYFNVSAIPTDKLNFITIPENIESKFVKENYCLIKRNEICQLSNISEQILAGEERALERVKLFKNSIEIENLSRAEISNVAIVLNTFENISIITDFKKIITLSHIVAEYSPQKDKGMIFKAVVVDKVAELILKCSLEELYAIKGFKVNSFKDSQIKLSCSIDTWLLNNLFSIQQIASKNFSELIRRYFDTGIENWFVNQIENRIKEFLSIINKRSVGILYNWISIDIEILTIIEFYIENSKKAESWFLSELPKHLPDLTINRLIKFSSKQNWLKFHAKLLLLINDFENALVKQLILDTDTDYIEGIEIITQSVKPKILVNNAAKYGDERLISIASQLCFNNPLLLNSIEFENKNWKKIWLSSIENGVKLVQSFTNPQNTIFKLFDTIIEGNIIDEKLFNYIGESDYSNIIDYKKRNEFWDRIPITIKTKFFIKTAAALLENLSQNPTIEIPNDKQLSDYIVKYAIGDFLFYNRGKLKNVMPIFRRFNQIPESNIEEYLRNYQGNIDAIDAMQLGELVSINGYKSIASLIYNKSTKNNNWVYALDKCYHLLGFLSRASLALSGISLSTVKIPTDEWWAGTEDIIIDLFPNGNSISTIWRKAGGKEYDLLTQGTASDIWKDIILKIRQGRFKKTIMNKLLESIKKIYPDNEKFNLIYKLRKYYIDRE